MSSTFHHETVLGPESVSLLDPSTPGWYADVTLGGGGHSALILQAGGPEVRVFGLDRDPAALASAGARLAAAGERFRAARGSFSALSRLLAEAGISALQGLIADLGVSSPQLDVPERGFSFRRAGPVDMRMDPEAPLSAAALIDALSEAELAELIWRYGEENHARRVARAVVQGRPFADTGALADAISSAVPGRSERIHKATRTFQALRIAVNDELGQLSSLLDQIPRLMAPGGRVVIIAYHSLEDRMVKQRFRSWAGLDSPRDPYGNPVVPPIAAALTRKAHVAEDKNPRARSARMRAVQML